MQESLILVAHADDETLGAGGAIPKLVRQGWKVTVVVISDTYRFGGQGKTNRPGTEAACELLGVHELHVLDVPDQKFDALTMAELSQKVADLKQEPDLIITNAASDLNLDHRLTNEVAKIIGRPRRKPVSILACEIPSTSFWNGNQFPANFYVDISETLQLKMEAFRKYENEIQDFPHPWSDEGLRLLAQYHGMQCGMPFAEAFQVIRAYEGRLPGN